MTRWLARYKPFVTSASAVVGVCLIAWAYFVEGSWGQGLLVNVGTALLLFAPLFVLNRALEERVASLSQDLRILGVAYDEAAERISDPVERGERFDMLVEDFRASNPEPLTKGRIAELSRLGVPFRVIALDAMTHDRSLLDERLVLRGVVSSESGNEQLYALDAALSCWSQITPTTRAEILQCIEGQGEFTTHIWNDPARVDVALRIIDADRALTRSSSL